MLLLTSEFIETPEPERRRALIEAQRDHYEADPSYSNLLGLTLLRALDASRPADLLEVRTDLQVLAGIQGELVPEQRHLALLMLRMVDERLRVASEIGDLRQQIDSLTEIEASLDQEVTPEPGP